MSCCGHKRSQVAVSLPGAGRAALSVGVRAPVAPPQVAKLLFECVADAPVTARGPSTHQTYHFGGAGARVWVDARDAPGLAELAALRRLAF